MPPSDAALDAAWSARREPPPVETEDTPGRRPASRPGPAAGPSSKPGVPKSRAIPVGFGLALLAFWVLLYLADPRLYLSLIRFWVPEAMPVPFYDSAYLTAQLECWRQGVDVYVANPCESSHIRMVYPPLWLRLGFLPAGRGAAMPFALAVDAAFVVSLAVLPRLTRWRDVFLVLAAIGSSAIGYGLERGNVDLLIFVLGALAALSLERAAPGRIAGYATVAAMALLKLYPVALLPLILRERRRVAIPVAAAVVAVMALAVVVWRDEWRAMLANIPGPDYSNDGPGARKLAEGLFILGDWVARHPWLADGRHLDDLFPRRAWTAALFAGLAILAMFGALRLARRERFQAAVEALSSRETSCLLVGALLFCGCFAMGTSNAYREVFVVLALPALLRFSRDPALPRPVRLTAWLTMPTMWGSFPALLCDIRFGKLGPYGGPMPTFAFWAVRETVWWWLFVVLTASLFARASLEGIVDIHAREERTAA